MIRLAKIEDLKNIMIIIEDARNQLKQRGSLQWNTPDGYPEATDMINDIVLHKLFVYEENEILKGCITMCESDDGYNNYNFWKSTEYVALHRLAILKSASGEGIGTKLMKHCIEEAKDKAVRGDTHPTNDGMIKVFEKCGFEFRGDILLDYLDECRERVAYELIK